jgi:hypothetical protein
MKDSHKSQVASHKMKNSRKLQVSSLKSQDSHAMVAGGNACFICLFAATISRKKLLSLKSHSCDLQFVTCDCSGGTKCS